LSLAGVNGLTINSIGKVLSDADMISAIGGYLALIGVPGLAWMLLKIELLIYDLRKKTLFIRV